MTITLPHLSCTPRATYSVFRNGTVTRQRGKEEVELACRTLFAGLPERVSYFKDREMIELEYERTLNGQRIYQRDTYYVTLDNRIDQILSFIVTEEAPSALPG